MSILITLGVVFGLLLLAEQLRRKQIIHGEIARKFVHITVGAFIATWPYYLSMLSIQFICLLMLVGVVASRFLSIFQAIHGVRRKTWGDMLFPLGIGLAAMLASEPWIFSAAVLHLSLADGAAALVGERYKKAGKYVIAGQKKTIVGTTVFWAISFMILLVLILTHQSQLSLVAVPLLLGLTSVVTFAENVTPSSADNIVVPFLVTAALNSLLFAG